MVEYYLSMLSANFKTLVLRHTRVTSRSASLLDHIWFSKDKLNHERCCPKKLWSTINKILGRPSYHNEVKSIELSGQTISNPVEICCAFNKYFRQVGSLLAQNFHDDGDPLQILDNIGTIDDFKFVEVPEDYVKTIVEKMRSSSAGYDNISVRILNIILILLVLLSRIVCSRSSTSGIFPNNLKIAKIKCIFKKGIRCDVNTYRLISFLPAFGKLKKIVFDLVYHNFTVNNLFTA